MNTGFSWKQIRVLKTSLNLLGVDQEATDKVPALQVHILFHHFIPPTK